MDLSPAPLFEDVAGGPPGGAAHWLRTGDGIRIRVGHWRPEGTAHGTVFLFPGRTEYVEKYGDAAREFTRRGLAMLAVDWLRVWTPFTVSNRWPSSVPTSRPSGSSPQTN